MKITREQIDNISDSELALVAMQTLGTSEIIGVNAAGAFALMQAAGARGWQLSLIHRAGLGWDSLASIQFVPGYQAGITVFHPRPELAVFRAFLYATACGEGPRE